MQTQAVKGTSCAPSSSSTSSCKTPSIRHEGFKCDGCEVNPIVGVRFHCCDCEDYDLCEKCEVKSKNIHDSKHSFTEIVKPTTAPVPSSSCGPSSSNGCNPNTGCCPPKQECKPASSNSSNCCGSQNNNNNNNNIAKRPLPPPPGKTYTVCKHDKDSEETTSRIAPTKLNANMFYSGQALRAVTLPLGGLGTGSIAFAGDGGLREWQVQGMVNHQAHVPNSFFGFRYGTDAVLLQSAENYYQTGFVPAPLITDHLVPESSIQLLGGTIPSIPSLNLTAKYPLVSVNYNLPQTSVYQNLQVTLNTYNPCIPLDSFNSALPIIIFQFSVKNLSTTTTSKDFAFLISQQNFLGWDSISKINNNSNPLYGGNINTMNPSMNSIFMTNSNASRPNEAVSIGVIPAPNSQPKSIQYYPVWTDVKSFWSDFSQNKTNTNNNGVASPSGSTFNSGLWVNFDPLPPNGTANVTLYLSWMFPNFFVNWGQPYPTVPNPGSTPTQLWLGHYYCQNFNNSMTQLMTYINNNLYKNVNLDAVTKNFVKTFYDESSLSWEILESAGGRISVPRSPTCMLTANGRFHAFEGCNGASTQGGSLGGVGGCCPMDCTHVWCYEMTLSRLWPELDRGMRITDLVERISPYGAIPERSVLPAASVKQEWALWPDFKGDNSQTGQNLVCIDGEIGTILKTYRELQQGGRSLLNTDWWLSVYNGVKKVMNHVMSSYDNSNDGVIRGLQFNTYDDVISGANTFIGCYYLCALLAMSQMTQIMGETALSHFYKQRFELGSANLNTLTWNASFGYYINVNYDPAFDALGNGCFIDQLLGQWWSHSLDLGYLLPRSNVISTVESLVSHNFQVGFPKNEQGPRIYMDMRDSGLWNCRWPNGGVPPIPMLYNSECWSGVEYPIAALSYYNKIPKLGDKLLSAIRARQDGTRRSPWNEVECGDHYSRQQSSYLLIEAASGYHWDGIKRKMKWGVGELGGKAVWSGFWITGEAWGKYQETHHTATIEVRYGVLHLEQLQLERTTRPTKVTQVIVNGIQIQPTKWKAIQEAENTNSNSNSNTTTNVVRVIMDEKDAVVELKVGEKFEIVFS